MLLKHPSFISFQEILVFSLILLKWVPVFLMEPDRLILQVQVLNLIYLFFIFIDQNN